MKSIFVFVLSAALLFGCDQLALFGEMPTNACDNADGRQTAAWPETGSGYQDAMVRCVISRRCGCNSIFQADGWCDCHNIRE